MPLETELKNSSECRKGNRSVWFEQGWQETSVYHREPLKPGSVIHGPALLEQMDSTIVLEPDDTMEVDPFGNLILTLNS